MGKQKPALVLYLDNRTASIWKPTTHYGSNCFQLEVVESVSLQKQTSSDEEATIHLLEEIFAQKSFSKKSILVLSPKLLRQFEKLIPAASEEEVKEGLPFEIEETTGHSVEEFVYGFRTANKIEEKGLLKMKVRIVLLTRSLFEKINNFFRAKNFEAQIFAATEEINQTAPFLKLNEIISLKEPSKFPPARLKERPLFLGIITILLFIIFIGLGAHLLKTQGNRPSRSNSQPESLAEISSGTTDREVAVIRSTTYHCNNPAVTGEPIFTYETPHPIPSPPNPGYRLVGTSSGSVTAALVQRGIEILVFKPGEKISYWTIQEISPDKITLRNNSKTRSVCLGEEI